LSFRLFTKIVSKVVCSSKMSAYKISWTHIDWCKLHPPQKFERPPFWNGWSYGI
jgi:hypothetical protein